jgi:predicted DNA binding CopG/RHH family protein
MTKREQGQGTAQRRTKSRIPTFDTVEEEAAFWDTHELTEFEDELEVVTDVKFVKAKPKKAITVRLEPDMLRALTKEARERGIGPSTLARMWILEHLRREKNAKNDR